ncbi:Dual specificity protein phosphatase 1 isoform 2 [Tripterygium wilfordii]|uniref:Dual specificity protein phosphatase 1 isoform 2 n=1 Tax=Tripterygium wilfordii TaxID=458696 RepID=A0A7J7CSG5_TRIWF|nr:dual specificity protein phosphatase 1-like [Tripterygium wilfordii]XP_038722780.1 dual specificity protein phosphatase 1-like [Tripterygium wilfordii]KAF5736826.1 Dual specificity protein phosphatase 1 isoform 2 [Tripterygium wilfordii]
MQQIDDAGRNQMAALMRVFDWSKCFKDDVIPCKIEEGLFLGSLGAANNKSELKRLNVTHILTVASSLPPAHPDDFVYKVIPVMDRPDTDLRQYFDECFSFIDEAKEKGGGVLVHCFVGRSRSATIVIAYLMKKHGMSLSQAQDHVKSRRPQVCPNVGFMKQLQDFEKSLQDQKLANEEEKLQ